MRQPSTRIEDLQGFRAEHPGSGRALEMGLGLGLGSDGEAGPLPNGFCKS